MLTDDVPIPVYFTNHHEEVENIITEISHASRDSKQKDSALVEMLNKISQNGYQVVVSAGYILIKFECYWNFFSQN